MERSVLNFFYKCATLKTIDTKYVNLHLFNLHESHITLLNDQTYITG